jgi:hypothetical protein
MNADRTIVLYLTAHGHGGIIGDGSRVYPPSHPDYQMVLAHLGGLEPGESKPVPPFPSPG